jgi:uncharacterized protein (UPF0335 family)
MAKKAKPQIPRLSQDDLLGYGDDDVPTARGKKTTKRDNGGPGETTESARLLTDYVERLARIEDDLLALREDRKDVIAEAKGRGFDPKALKAAVKLHRDREAKEAHEEFETLLDLYLTTLDNGRDD